MTPARLVVCSWGDPQVPREIEELLTLGRRASTESGAELHWLLLGALPSGAVEIARAHGVGGIDRIDDPRLEGFPPDLCVEALARYCGRHAPLAILFPQNPETRLIAPRLAGRLGSAVVMNAVDVEIRENGSTTVTASAYGGDTRVVYEVSGPRPRIVGITANAVSPERLGGSGSEPRILEEPVDLGGTEERVRVLERARAEGPRLEDAQVIVAGGRGLGSRENYQLVRDLADALGGVAGASRPIVDDGWADPSRQVGLTGRITRPALYLAAGISGASQHMVGCAAAKTIVAINRDPDAAIFRHARYGIVGDCLAILPELIRAARER